LVRAAQAGCPFVFIRQEINYLTTNPVELILFFKKFGLPFFNYGIKIAFELVKFFKKMKNSLKIMALALVMAVSFTACGGKKGGSASDSTKSDSAKTDTVTKQTVDTLKKDTVIKNDSAHKDTTVKTVVKKTETKKVKQ
jgi:predicted small lipoprotein YifL